VIDLHSHILPGVDDGSRSVSQSVQVLARLADQGVRAVCLTPHLLASVAVSGVPAAHDRAFERLRAEAPPGIALYRGAEIMLDRPLDARVAQDRAVTLNRTRYLLVEFPRLVTRDAVDQALAGVRGTGLVAVLAHPERYKCCTPAAAQAWKAEGTLLQVDGPTLLSASSRGERARDLVREGLAAIAAGDNHGDDRSLRPVQDALADIEGGRQAELLLVANPQAILEDRPVEDVPPLAWRISVVDRLRSLLDRSVRDRP
jgi:protein-tyrosine phosphatase